MNIHHAAWRCAIAGLALLVALSPAGCRRRPSDDRAPSPAIATVSASVSEPVVVPAFGDAGDASAPLAELPDVRTDWCLDGWRGLDEGTCYLVPDGWAKTDRRRLLIYLAGIVPPLPSSPQKLKVEQVVAAAARRAGVVALLPRGRRGIGPKNAKDWWAWPTSAKDHATYAPEMVASFLDARARLEGALGSFERTYLAGSSSGAYFLTTLALSGAIAMDGYAAASGGAPLRAGSRVAAGKRKVPFYVGYGAGDPTNGGPKALAAFLTEAGWPVRVGEHPGGHGAREVYLDEAFAFWDEAS